MKSYQTKVDDLEQQVSNPSVFNSLFSKSIMSKFSSILAICLITFTSLLARQTLEIQHSCNPMIHWSGELPTECQVVAKNSSENFSSQKKQIAVKTNSDNSSFQKKQIPVKTNSDSSDTSNSQIKKSIAPKQQLDIAQNTVKYQPNENTDSTEFVESKTIKETSQSEPEKKSASVGQLIKKHPVETTIAGASVVVGAALTVAALPLIGIPVAIAGVGVAVYSIFH